MGSDFADRVRRRMEARRSLADEAESARLAAMEAALRKGMVVAVCPDAVVVAGDAATAEARGESETGWLERAYESGLCGGGGELARAVQVLKLVGVWPWRPIAGPNDRPRGQEARSVAV